MFKVEEIRKDFPMLNNKLMQGKPLVYFDNGATTFKPQSVIDEVTKYYTDYTCNAHRGDYELSALTSKKFETARERVASLLNCQSKEVVFTSGASQGLNMVAYGYGSKFLKEGDIILTTEAEHASNLLPWFRVADETKAQIKYIALDNGRITVENFKAAMNEKVKVVVFASVTNVLGYLAPVKDICTIAHQYNAIVIVDGAQEVPHHRVDVCDSDIDFLAFSAHKMCGPTGIGVLYGKYDLLNKMDAFNLGGGSNTRFDMCGNYQLKYPPFKFEAGTQPIEAALGFKAAIDYLLNVGYDNIAKQEHLLHEYLISKMKENENLIIYNEDSDGGIITFNVKGIFAQDVASYLSTQGVAVRSGNHCAKILLDIIEVNETVRASVYFYNTIEECDVFIEALKNATIENCISVIF